MITDRDPNRTVTSGFLLDLDIPVTVRFARKRMLMGDVAALRRGCVVPLDRLPDDPVELLVNGVPVARGQVVNADGNCAIRITELVRQNAGKGHLASTAKE